MYLNLKHTVLLLSIVIVAVVIKATVSVQYDTLVGFSVSSCTPGDTRVNDSIVYECYMDGKTKGIRPIACLNEIGEEMEPGEAWSGVYFVYSCTKPDPDTDLLTYDIVACLTPSGSVMHTGETIEEDGGEYSCILNSNSSVTRHFKATTKCSWKGLSQKVGHSFEDGDARLECIFINGELKIYARACLLPCDSNNATCLSKRDEVAVGRTVLQDNKVYKCIRNTTQHEIVKLVVTENNCTDNGTSHAIGDEWISDNYLYKCELRGLVAEIVLKKCIYHPHPAEVLSIGLQNVQKSKTDGFYYWCKHLGNAEYSVIALSVAQTQCNETVNGVPVAYFIGETWVQDNIGFKCSWGNTQATIREIGCSTSDGIRLAIDEVYEIEGDAMAFICERFDAHYFYRQLTYEEYSEWKLEYSSSVSASGQKGHGSRTTIEEKSNVSLPVQELNCSAALLDLVFIVDLSSSMTPANLDNVRYFLLDMVYDADLNCDETTRFGLILYNDTSKKMIIYRNLTEYAHLLEVEISIDHICPLGYCGPSASANQQTSNHTNNAAGEALKTAKEVVFVEENGCRRLEAVQAVILITDAAGKNVGVDPIQTAAELEREFITTYVLGVNIDSVGKLNYLTKIAGTPNNVFVTENFTTLLGYQFRQELVDSISTDLPALIKEKEEGEIKNISGVTQNITATKPDPAVVPTTRKPIPITRIPKPTTTPAPVHPKCPGKHMEYMQCGSSCQPSCEDPFEEMYCIAMCSAGCFCKHGYLMSIDATCKEADTCIKKAKKNTMCGNGVEPSKHSCGLGKACPDSSYNCVYNGTANEGVCCPTSWSAETGESELKVALNCQKSSVKYGQKLSTACTSLNITNIGESIDKVDVEIPRIIVISIQKKLVIDPERGPDIESHVQSSCRPITTQSCVLKMIPFHQALGTQKSLDIKLYDIPVECDHMKGDTDEQVIAVVVTVDPFHTAFNNCITTTVDIQVDLEGITDTNDAPQSCESVGSLSVLGYNGLLFQTDANGKDRLIKYDKQGDYAKFHVENHLHEDMHYSRLRLLKQYYQNQIDNNGATCEKDEAHFNLDHILISDKDEESTYEEAMKQSVIDDIANKQVDEYLENITRFIEVVDRCLSHPAMAQVLNQMSCSYRKIMSAVLIIEAKFEQLSIEQKERRDQKKHSLQNQLYRPSHIWLEDAVNAKDDDAVKRFKPDSAEICLHKKMQAAFLRHNLTKIYTFEPGVEQQLSHYEKRAQNMLGMVEGQEMFETEMEETGGMVDEGSWFEDIIDWLDVEIDNINNMVWDGIDDTNENWFDFFTEVDWTNVQQDDDTDEESDESENWESLESGDWASADYSGSGDYDWSSADYSGSGDYDWDSSDYSGSGHYDWDSADYYGSGAAYDSASADYYESGDYHYSSYTSESESNNLSTAEPAVSEENDHSSHPKSAARVTGFIDGKPPGSTREPPTTITKKSNAGKESKKDDKKNVNDMKQKGEKKNDGKKNDKNVKPTPTVGNHPGSEIEMHMSSGPGDKPPKPFNELSGVEMHMSSGSGDKPPKPPADGTGMEMHMSSGSGDKPPKPSKEASKVEMHMSSGSGDKPPKPSKEASGMEMHMSSGSGDKPPKPAADGSGMEMHMSSGSGDKPPKPPADGPGMEMHMSSGSGDKPPKPPADGSGMEMHMSSGSGDKPPKPAADGSGMEMHMSSGSGDKPPKPPADGSGMEMHMSSGSGDKPPKPSKEASGMEMQLSSGSGDKPPKKPHADGSGMHMSASGDKPPQKSDADGSEMEMSGSGDKPPNPHADGSGMHMSGSGDKPPNKPHADGSGMHMSGSEDKPPKPHADGSGMHMSGSEDKPPKPHADGSGMHMSGSRDKPPKPHADGSGMHMSGSGDKPPKKPHADGSGMHMSGSEDKPPKPHADGSGMHMSGSEDKPPKPHADGSGMHMSGSRDKPPKPHADGSGMHMSGSRDKPPKPHADGSGMHMSGSGDKPPKPDADGSGAMPPKPSTDGSGVGKPESKQRHGMAELGDHSEPHPVIVKRAKRHAPETLNDGSRFDLSSAFKGMSDHLHGLSDMFSHHSASSVKVGVKGGKMVKGKNMKSKMGKKKPKKVNMNKLSTKFGKQGIRHIDNGNGFHEKKHGKCRKRDINKMINLVSSGSPISSCPVDLPMYIWHEENGTIYRGLYANGQMMELQRIAACSCASAGGATCNARNRKNAHHGKMEGHIGHPNKKHIRTMIEEILEEREGGSFFERGIGHESAEYFGESGGRNIGNSHESGGSSEGEDYGYESSEEGFPEYGSFEASAEEFGGSSGEEIHRFVKEKAGKGKKGKKGGSHGKKGHHGHSMGVSGGFDIHETIAGALDRLGGSHGHGKGKLTGWMGGGGADAFNVAEPDHSMGMDHEDAWKAGGSGISVQVGVGSASAEGDSGWWDWFGDGSHSGELHSLGSHSLSNVTVDTRSMADHMRKMIDFGAAFSSTRSARRRRKK